VLSSSDDRLGSSSLGTKYYNNKVRNTPIEVFYKQISAQNSNKTMYRNTYECRTLNVCISTENKISFLKSQVSNTWIKSKTHTRRTHRTQVYSTVCQVIVCQVGFLDKLSPFYWLSELKMVFEAMADFV
jgi:hypothetical protein